MMETPESLLIRLTGHLETQNPKEILDFRNATVHTINEVIQKTDTELLFACQMNTGSDSTQSNGILFAARVEFRRVYAKNESRETEKKQLLTLFVERFAENTPHKFLLPMVNGSEPDVYDFMMRSDGYYLTPA